MAILSLHGDLLLDYVHHFRDFDFVVHSFTVTDDLCDLQADQQVVQSCRAAGDFLQSESVEQLRRYEQH